MKDTHINFYTEKVKHINFCGETLIYEVEGYAYQLPYEIETIEGEHDFNSCEGCQKNLRFLRAEIENSFNGKKGKLPFPNCCEQHKKLNSFKDFKREHFLAVPEMVAKKIIQTKQCIINSIKQENYYKLITDYIIHAVESFGQMPKGHGERLYLVYYLKHIKSMVENDKELPTEKQKLLVAFINRLLTPASNEKADLNIIISTYEKWFKLFPFELNTYFAELKPHFQKSIPLFQSKPEINIYTKKATYKPHTKESLFHLLTDLTNDLLIKINGATLYENGFIKQPEKIKLELIIQKRKQKLKTGYKNSSNDEQHRFIKMIKDWLNDEIEFVNELKPILEPPPPTKAEILKTKLNKYGFFQLKTINKNNAEKIISLLAKNEVPYCVAMLKHLGFIDYLFENYCRTTKERDKILGGIFEIADRTIKGNINALTPKTTENKTRYTAHTYKQQVIKDYQN